MQYKADLSTMSLTPHDAQRADATTSGLIHRTLFCRWNVSDAGRLSDDLVALQKIVNKIGAEPDCTLARVLAAQWEMDDESQDRPLTLMNSEVNGEYVMICENQRRPGPAMPYSGWSLLPTERGSWTKAKGTEKCTKMMASRLPGPDWKWTSDWQVDERLDRIVV